MPTLPDITVTKAQLDVLVSVFPGATLAEKAEAYRVWSINNLIDLVEKVKSAEIREELLSTMESRLDALRASLPPRGEVPLPTPPMSPTMQAIETTTIAATEGGQ